MSEKEFILKKIEEFNSEDRINLKLLEHSIHFLFGEITEDNVMECTKWLTYENLDQKQSKLLTIYINSTGGDLYAAFALIDIMKNSFHPIRVVGVGSVMSAAFLIFASGTKGERYAARNTSFMCHQYSDNLAGKHHDLKATMRDGELCNQKMVDILRSATGLSITKIKTKLLPASDVYLTAQETVNYGVADKIL